MLKWNDRRIIGTRMHTENGSYAGSVYAWINSGAVLRERTAALYAGERHILEMIPKIGGNAWKHIIACRQI